MNNYMQNMNFPETDLNQLYRHFIWFVILEGWGIDMRRELKCLTGGELRGNEVLKPNHYIVAGLF